MSYIHPAAAEHQRKRWLRHDAHRFAAPGSPEAETGLMHSWAEVARQEQAAADEAKARALAEQDEFEREVLRLRHELAKIRLDYELRRFQQKYSPDQPRVPAGNPDGGQWTSGGGEGADRSAGSGRSESVGPVLSDESPDPIRPGAQYAQAGYPINLQQEEARGGHTIEKHVNRSPEALVAQVREVFDGRPYARNVHSGSFSSLEAATKLVNSTLAQNQDIVDKVASGLLSEKTVFAQFNSITGIEAVAAHIGSPVSIRETYGVGVLVVHDPSSAHGYIVRTAFPSNQR